MKKLLTLFTIMILFIPVIKSQTEDKNLLTIDRIFNSREFSSQWFGPARWIDNDRGYTTLETSKEFKHARDIVKFDLETVKSEILVDAKHLIPEGETEPLSIADYQWSKDGKKLLIYTNTKRVWRRNTKGDYWVVDLQTWKLQKMGGREAKPSTLMFAKFSPDSRKVAYVRENNVYSEDLATGKITQLTFDGTDKIINGTFDWVYEEELDDRDGFRWSPDSKSIAYWHLDSRPVPIFYLINNTDSLYPFLKPIPYPKVNQANSICKVGVVSADGGNTTWMNVPGDPQNHYIARMDWADNSDELVIQQLNRPENTDLVMLCNAKNGETRTILTEKDSAWVDVVNDFMWLNNGKEFTWVSERDGWRHIYIVSRDGKDLRLLTPDSFDVINIEKIDENGEFIYFIASPDNAGQRYLYRVNINGTPHEEKLTPVSLAGTNGYQISETAKYAFHYYSNFGTPLAIDLVSLPDHKTIRTLVDNAELKEKVEALKRTPVEFFNVTTDDSVKIDGWMMKPYNFDPSKKYPVLFYVYGEPAGQTVMDTWGGSTYLWHLMLTQQGYIVVSVDNRGTPAPRGREWRKCIYEKIGILNSYDQAKAANAIFKKYDFIDTSRVGVWGWSGGGSMTLNLMFRYPEIYKTGMSVAPVSTEWLYDDIYQERYMNLWDVNEKNYIEGSPITYAKDLKGNLLVVHGTGDDNVHFQGTERLINELIKQNKLFTIMIYPNRSHGIYEGENTSRHLREVLTNYLESHLAAGGR
jgi:dipeptidyl-peptidase-4